METVETDEFANMRRLRELRGEHRKLDAEISKISEEGYVDQIYLTRLKKRKLMLKDLIVRLESELIPDLNA